MTPFPGSVSLFSPGLASFPWPSLFHLPHLGLSPASRAAVSCSPTPFTSPDSLCAPGLSAAPFGALTRCFSGLCFPSDPSLGALRKEGVPVFFLFPQFPAPPPTLAPFLLLAVSRGGEKTGIWGALWRGKGLCVAGERGCVCAWWGWGRLVTWLSLLSL